MCHRRSGCPDGRSALRNSCVQCNINYLFILQYTHFRVTLSIDYCKRSALGTKWDRLSCNRLNSPVG